MFGVDDLASEVTIPGQSTYKVARLRPPPTQGVIYTCTRPVSPTTNTKVSMIAFFSPTFWSSSYDLAPVNCRHTIQVRITTLDGDQNPVSMHHAKPVCLTTLPAYDLGSLRLSVSFRVTAPDANSTRVSVSSNARARAHDRMTAESLQLACGGRAVCLRAQDPAPLRWSDASVDQAYGGSNT